MEQDIDAFAVSESFKSQEFGLPTEIQPHYYEADGFAVSPLFLERPIVIEVGG